MAFVNFYFKVVTFPSVLATTMQFVAMAGDVTMLALNGARQRRLPVSSSRQTRTLLLVPKKTLPLNPAGEE